MKRVCENGLWGTMDKNGNWVIPCRYEEFEKFHYGAAWVKETGQWGLMDKAGVCRWGFGRDFLTK